MRRRISTLLWLLLMSTAALAQNTTTNLQLNTPPFNASGWNTLINQNFTTLDNVFAGITPSIWHPSLRSGGSFVITDALGNPVFSVSDTGVVQVYGSLKCTGSPCGNGATGVTLPPTFSLASGTYTTAQALTLASTGNTVSWCTTATGSCNPNTTYTGTITVNATETVCANAQNGTTGYSATLCTAYTINTGGGGGGGGGTAGDPGTNIGTVARTGLMTDGSIAFKTCYVGSSVCSGGVGTLAPSSTPQSTFGLSTPNASTGTAGAVASFSLSTAHPAGSFTDALWTTTGGGLGADTTSTNWARDFYIKVNFPAGHTHVEFDTYDFAGGWDWMWGTQCNSTSKLIQYDNQTNGWVNTQIPCSALFDGNWHHIEQTFHKDLAAQHNCAAMSAPCEWWDTLTFDGTTYAIGKSLPATTTTWTGSGGQWQLDTSPTTASSGSPATAQIYVDTDRVSAGDAGDGNSNPGGNGGNTAGTGELDSFNFDSGTPTGAGLTVVGAATTSTSNFHSSPNSAQFIAGNNYFIDQLSTPTNVLYTRQYVYFSSVGTNSNGFLRLYHGGADMINFFLSASTGNPTYFDVASNASVAIQGTPFPMNAVHMVETYTKISSTAGQIIVKIDGTTVYTSANTLNTGTQTIDTVWFGQVGNVAPSGWGTTYMDNVDFSATGWIGPI